jgi:hypothetical protein
VFVSRLVGSHLGGISTNITIYRVGESQVLQATSPGIAPGSKAIYEKTVDAAEVTIQSYKTTLFPKGRVHHVADKIFVI